MGDRRWGGGVQHVSNYHPLADIHFNPFNPTLHPPRKLSSKATTGLSFAIFVVEILNCLLIIANDKERQRFGLSMGSVGPADVEYTVNLSARYIFYKKKSCWSDYRLC